jgi:hypothetical protein
MTDALLRFIKILVAYGLAALAAGYAVYLALLIFPSATFGHDATAAGFTYGLMVTMFVSIFAALPAALVVSLGEFRSWRMWWYYAIAGSAIGATLGKMFAPPEWFLWLGLGFGPVSGLVYWVVAGRSAGMENATLRNGLAAIFLIITIVQSFWLGSTYFKVWF